MSDLIPSISQTDFLRILKMGRIKELKSCEVTKDGEHLFTAIIPHGDVFSQDYAKTQAEFLGVKSNIESGLTPDEVLGKEAAVASI